MSRIGDFIETNSGIAFYPLDPRPEEIDIHDAAHALARQCRFSGHTKRFYSVAQHSLNVMKLVRAWGYTERTQLLGLLHDMTEAYMVDLPRPLKHLMPEYEKAEHDLAQVIYRKYGVEGVWYEAVKKADDAMLAYEAWKLMPCECWSPKTDVPRMDFAKAGVDLGERPMQDVQRDFLDAFYALTTAIEAKTPVLDGRD